MVSDFNKMKDFDFNGALDHGEFDPELTKFKFTGPNPKTPLTEYWKDIQRQFEKSGVFEDLRKGILRLCEPAEEEILSGTVDDLLGHRTGRSG